MKARLFASLLGVILTCGLAAWVPAADSATEPAETDDVQDFVFLTETRPVLIRLHVRIDGIPFRAFWDDAIENVFQHLDADKDGSLNAKEADRTPPAQILFGGDMYGRITVPWLGLMDSNDDKKVSLEELRSFYRKNGAEPFQVRSSSDGTGVVTIIGGGAAPPSADALNEALFELLDTNKDDKLSREELTAAPRVLLKRDSNDDEVLTAREVVPAPNPGLDGEFTFVQESFSPGGSNPLCVPIVWGKPSADLGWQMLARYGPKGKKPARKPGLEEEPNLGEKPVPTLSPKDIGLDETSFRCLDTNRDGRLDSTELARFTALWPDAELIARLGKTGPKEAPMDIVVHQDRPAVLTSALKKSGPFGNIVFDLDVTTLDLRCGITNTRGQAQALAMEELYKAEFAAADRDANGYLDDKEAKTIPYLSALFKVMDRDSDEKLYEKEVLAYFKEIKDLQARASGASVSLSVVDQGRGLLDLLDANRDGRLSVREMRGTINLLKSLDRDKNGVVAKSEIPRTYQLTVNQGGGNSNFYGVFAFSPTDLVQPAAPKEEAKGPLWFRKMDRNRDGDVSRREFLGTDEQFAEIDTDGDVLISPEEAERADAKFRKQ